MIRLVEPAAGQPLSARQRFALDLLVDLSRLVRTDDVSMPAVALHVGSGATPVSVESLRTGGPALEISDGIVAIEREALDVVARLAGAIDEQHCDALDRYGRVPAAASMPVLNGVAREPVVHRVADALREAARQAAGSRRIVLLAPWPHGKRWALAITHDIDVVAAWPVFTGMRLAELLRKAQLRRAIDVAGSAVRAVMTDPVTAAVRTLLDVERRLGVRATWFMITGTPTLSTARAGDVTYTPESPRARAIVGDVTGGGHELGLHGSFATYTATSVFAEQRARLTAIAGREIHGVRQHFLRMQPGTTHRAMVDAGFGYDSTFGFADRNGFRLGVADVVPVWHDAESRQLEMDEMPFAWMDRALSKYAGEEDPMVWVDDALALAQTCRDVQGAWCGIWHPNLTTSLGYPGAEAAFALLLERLMGLSPWTATMGEIVAWRRARRGARAVGVDASGAVRLRQRRDAASLTLEDANGQPVNHVAA